MSDATRDEICVVACADAWRGDGAVLASAFGVIPTLAVRLARATFEPNLLVSDGEAMLIANVLPYGSRDVTVEGWAPFRTVFDMVWSGRRHVMMGATQIDRYGNQNISCIGDHSQPKIQLIGVRGAPGNSVNHPTSYWVPKHSPRVFVDRVDLVSGVGYDNASTHPEAARYHAVRFVVTNLCVFDFETPDHSMRLRSVHPGVSVEDVVSETGFEPAIPREIPLTRSPLPKELRLIRDVLDPGGVRRIEVKP